MSTTVISVENLSKSYRLGVIGTGTFYGDLKRWWARQRGKPDPYLKIGEADHGNRDGETVWALRDVNFTVQQGQAVGIIGRNGAGKSTLLKILSQVTAPTSGAVKVKGRIASLLEVGTGFHPELTGRENIYLNGAILGMNRREIDRKFDEIVDFSGVEKFIDTPVKRYSSGMYVRLAFAVAAHLEPEILIVDEVLAVGDMEFQRKCLGKMGDVAHQGRTVLFVSHNMGAIESLCAQSILIKSGSIALIGDSKEIIGEYLKLSNNDLEVPLNIRTDRVGTGKLRFHDIKIDDQNIRNRSLHVDLSILNTTQKELQNVLLSIVISNHLGQEISNLVNYIVNRPISIDPNGAKARVNIRNINLVPGTYNINIFVSSDKQNLEIFDWVKNAGQFDVPDYDYYHMGHVPYIKGEIIYMDYDYEIT